jgi:hypothetical protein
LLASLAGEISKETAQKVEAGGSVARRVLTAIHARACQVGEEIVTLLRHGYPDAAHARWRTLHEMATVMFFIGEYGDVVAQRFLDHAAVETRKAAVEYQKHCRRLGLRRFSRKEMNHFEGEYQERLARYGSGFKETYAWAAQVLNRPKPNFTDIETAVALDHQRPYYRMANYNVHVAPKTLLVRLGLLDNQLRIAGPSYIGLADPGCGAAASLVQCTAALLAGDEVLDSLVGQHAMLLLGREVVDAFRSAEVRLDGATLVDIGDYNDASPGSPTVPVGH